ncbi:hypothetical protein ABT093_10245 [Kitasatospora sp. NPDC002551]|uniref:hypothetical protein n=1 Tax=Kitasatospora sp. NPDC002551 TaxID=3154539 RepID=UPI00331C05D8
MNPTRIFAWYESAIGRDALAYLLACEQDIREGIPQEGIQLSKTQISTVENLAQLTAATLSNESKISEAHNLVRGWLIQFTADGISNAREIHNNSKGITQEAEAPREPTAAAVHEVALDTYCAFLLPSNHPGIPTQIINPFASISMSQHPRRQEFIDFAMQDAKLARVFTGPDEPFGRSMSYLSNVGFGGALQLDLLLETILQRAWLIESCRVSPEAFAIASVEQFRMVRSTLQKSECPSIATFHLTGALLPTGSKVEIAGGTLRETTESERRNSPFPPRGEISGSDETGQHVVVNYDGDITLEIPFKYRHKVLTGRDGDHRKWMEENSSFAEAQRTVTRIRFALLLATNRNHRVQIIPTAQSFDIPPSSMPYIAWLDVKPRGMMPTQLTDGEVSNWSSWYEKLNSAGVDHIELAMRRTLRALSERTDPTDVLIDSVIAWENIFGTPEGEPTFRITMCLSSLLKKDPAERAKLQSTLSDIYNLRSQIVHGNKDLKPAEVPFCHQALDVAIEAIRKLVEERPDILSLSDGSKRSKKLLLGN